MKAGENFNPKTMKISDDSLSIKGRNINRVSSNPGGYTDGEVLTEYGIVAVYAQGDENHWYGSRLDFVHGGRLYIRNFEKKRLTHRGLVRQAGKFAREVATRLTPR